jgi:O-methyltransferase involved in polyketide biosynthesis
LKLSTNSIIQDEKAIEIVEKLDCKFSKFAAGWISQLDCVVRAKAYDEIADRFIKTHPHAAIINLDAGLCTRFFRAIVVL